jgi:uncharacterized membrane protein YdbT with pleckstrin-like domain
MKFIRKKNFLEGEELLYVPRLHWMYIVRHMALSLLFFLVLFIVWVAAQPIADLIGMAGIEGVLCIKTIVRYVFLATLIIALLVFVCRIFLYAAAEYGVTNKRLIIKKGIIRVVIAEIPTDRIESIYCLQGILGRIFCYGTLRVSGVGGMKPVFYMVSRPYVLHRKIAEVIEKNKTVTVVHGELLPRPEPPKPDPRTAKDPVYRYGTFVRVLGK